MARTMEAAGSNQALTVVRCGGSERFERVRTAVDVSIHFRVACLIRRLPTQREFTFSERWLLMNQTALARAIPSVLKREEGV